MDASGLISGMFKTTDRRIWIENLALVSALFVVPMLLVGPFNIAPRQASKMWSSWRLQAQHWVLEQGWQMVAHRAMASAAFQGLPCGV